MLSRSKQFLTITLIMALLVSTNFRASAIPVFSIGGTVTDDSGKPVANGTEVILTNKGRN
ncbi:hypothetical protein HYR99_10295 [Candidatus Poribacteria bacterium]|nr:hypothetical protein [Candidatus Poribacteria bacterium]